MAKSKNEIVNKRPIARLFLGLNAAFSLIIGLDLLITSEAVSNMIFVEFADWQPLTLRILGTGLLIFGLDLIIIATNRFCSKGQVILISAMDAIWVVASGILLVIDGHLFTELGKIAIILVSVFVAIFATGQYIGAQLLVKSMSRATVQSSSEKLFAKVSRIVDAPSEIVWSVMIDHPRYAEVADNISKVEVVSGEGLGMQRRCYGPKNENWLETCNLYEDGQAFGFKIHTEAEDYPYPISQLNGKWSLTSKGQLSEFSIDIEATPKGNFIVQTLFKLAAKRQFKAVLIDLADAWAERMENESSKVNTITGTKQKDTNDFPQRLST